MQFVEIHLPVSKALPLLTIDALSRQMKLSIAEETKWMVQISNGDHSAMSLLVSKWEEPLYRFFYRSLGNHADCQDLTQKTFLRTYKSAKTYQPAAKFSTWLFTIARNLLIDEIKRRKKFQTSEISEERINPEGLNSETKNIKDWQEILQIAIKEIPENHRSALLFRVQQEWSYMEIAKVMNANEQMVKTWIHRARQALKAKISELKMKGEL